MKEGKGFKQFSLVRKQTGTKALGSWAAQPSCLTRGPAWSNTCQHQSHPGTSWPLGPAQCLLAGQDQCPAQDEGLAPSLWLGPGDTTATSMRCAALGWACCVTWLCRPNLAPHCGDALRADRFPLVSSSNKIPQLSAVTTFAASFSLK